MIVRRAVPSEIDELMRLYDKGRQMMRASGNTEQWVNGYPSRELIADDIARGECFVIEGDDARPHAVFMFAVGEDPTYAVIEDGSWLNDRPYGVIHRIASDGQLRGMMATATAFALEQVDNVRIDTHASNYPMQRALEKSGYRRCGTIYCQDGTPRVAFHLFKQDAE